MRAQQSGFTLIELVIVIVILGILAIVALPRYVDLTTDASLAAVKGVAGAVSSASAVNYSTCSLRGVTGTNCTRLNAATACATLVTGAMTGAALPTTDYTISADATCAAQPAGTVVSCTITGLNSQTATASVLCTG